MDENVEKNPFDELIDSVEEVLTKGFGDGFKIVEAPLSEDESFAKPILLYDFPDFIPSENVGAGGLDIELDFNVSLIMTSKDIRRTQRIIKSGISKVALLFRFIKIHEGQKNHIIFRRASNDRLDDETRSYESWTAEFTIDLNLNGRHWGQCSSYPANVLTPGDCEGVIVG